MKSGSNFQKIALLIVILLLAQMFFVGNILAKEYLAFGIASPGGTFYQLGSGFAQIINKYVPEVLVTGEQTGGSTENVNMLATEQLDLAFAGSAYYLSAKDRGLDLSNIQLIGAGYVSAVQWIVLEDSPIRSITDFVGRKIAVGGVGSGTLETSQMCLEVGYGITFDDITALRISKTEMADALRDRQAEAVNLFADVPTPGVLDIASTNKVRIVPFTQEAAEKIYKRDPAYPSLVIEKGSYEWLEEDTLTIGTPCLFLVSAKLNEDLVYKIVKAIFEHPEEKNAIMQAAMGFNLESVFRGTGDLGMDFHPGAKKYYQEKGIWK